MLIIHYFNLSKKNIIGSVNARKINIMAAGKPVFSCAIDDFNRLKGHLINADWDGEYNFPLVEKLNFKLPQLGFTVLKNKGDES
jgi:hypothetical protein